MPVEADLVVAFVVAGLDGTWLQIRRAEATPHGGMLCFPGGRVEPGESAAEAVRREALEELGLHVRPLREIAEVDIEATSVRISAWLCEADGEPIANAAEVAEVLWLTAEELAAHPESMESTRLIAERLPPR